MKKSIMYFMLTSTALLFIGCISPQQQAENLWSNGSSSILYYYLKPVLLKSTEEAISIIKLNEPNFCNFYGDETVELNVDKYGLIMKTRWESQKTNYVVNPVTQSGFANSNLSSYYSNTTYVGQYQTSTKSGTDSITIQFKNLREIDLLFQGDRFNYNNWQISTSTQPGEYKFFRARDQQTASDLINAIYTLSIKAGATIQKNTLGLNYSKLTKQQIATLSDNSINGVVVNDVFVDSPAVKAGLQSNDVIIEINNNPIATKEDADEAIKKIKMNKVNVKYIRLSSFDEKKNIFNYNTYNTVISL